MKTAMMRITDILSHDRQQLLAPAVLALGAAGATGVLSHSHDDIFRPYFGSFHPLLAIALISSVGIVALRILSLRWKFKVYANREGWRGLRNSSILATLFAVSVILVDWRVRLPYSHVPPLESLLFYPTMAFVAEIVFHVLPLWLLLVVFGPMFEQRDPTSLAWLCILLGSCLEPIFQLNWSSSAVPLSGVGVYVGLHVFAFNVLQLYLFRRYDFVSMYTCRLVYYLYWHVIWGSARQYLLPV